MSSATAKMTMDPKLKTSKRDSLAKNGQEIVGGKLPGSLNLKTFPTDAEIEAFQSQLNVDSVQQLTVNFKNALKQQRTLPQFKSFLTDFFKVNEPADSLVVAMFERFKPFKLSDGIRENTKIEEQKEIDMRDFILAMNLLARITYDKKLKLLFELCDDDDDGCMTPEDILQMFMRVERVFA